MKKEKSQITYGLIVFFVILTICMLLWKNYYIYCISLAVGTIIGVILRYSRFCFAAVFRDPFITGNTKVMRAVILGLIISTIGFGFIGLGNQDISAVGVHTMIGAFIFGIGMVLAGGCATGLLMRLGEGHSVFLVVLIGFIIGSLLGAKDYKFWNKLIMKGSKVIYFPDYLDLKFVILIQVTLLIALYRLAFYYEKKHEKY